MDYESLINTATIVITAAVFLTKSFAYLFPIRTMDRLRLALFAEAATLAWVFTAATLRLWHAIPVHSPPWEAWAIRVCLIVFGIGVLVEMMRAGALRGPRRYFEEGASMISFVCDDDDRIFTEDEARDLDFRCPDCGADLDVMDDPRDRSAADFRREAEEKGKKHHGAA